MSSSSYESAGVNIAACDAWLDSLKRDLPGIGGFAGLFPLGNIIGGMKEPCLVSGADGVGTKVLVARAAGDLSTIGIDCVAMVVNDLICCGATPLFFLDYLALGKFESGDADAILRGLRHGCDLAGCTLLGGETAELPGLFPAGDFDVAGFGVGIVDRAALVDGSRVREGQVVIGLSSSGIHSNGLSLARKVLPEYESDEDVARDLLTPTSIYVRAIQRALQAAPICGIAHITGGGLPGNLARALPENVDVLLDPEQWKRPEVFDRIEQRGGIDAPEMFKTFNMGIGMCLIVEADDAERLLPILQEEAPAQVIGITLAGTGRVHLKGVDG
ncbi:phosphoribosylformylglycinamidine cyclo-ligase [bacterium]|nr:phosphoribosylformylglycinamidine cyclo-ligase [bacterium]